MTRMQSLQCNAEASSQTFLSIPPFCTRAMLRKSGDSLGTVNGVSYKEYFDDSSHTILTPSPKKLSIYEAKKEEICYKVSSVFTLHDDDKIKTSEQEYSEEYLQPEGDEKDKDAVCVGERPDGSTLKERVVVAEIPAVGSQGDAVLSEDLKDTAVEKEIEHIEFSRNIPQPALEKGDDYSYDTECNQLSEGEHSRVSSTKTEVRSECSRNIRPPALEKGDNYIFGTKRNTSSVSQHSKESSTKAAVGSEFSHNIPPPALQKSNDYSFDTERNTLSGSEHSLVSSTKAEVGSQPDLGSVVASSYELVSLIGSSLVSKPLMEAQSEGKCKKKKRKSAKNLKRVSKSVPHVVPEEMQHLNDFSRVVTQEAIYAEMSSGDDAFGANHDQYEDDEEDSSYSSESDDDASQANSQEVNDLSAESSSSFPAPAAPPASATSSHDDSPSANSRQDNNQPSDSWATLQDESESRGSSGQCSSGLEQLTESYIDRLGGASSEGLMSGVLRHPEISLSSLSPDRNTDVESSMTPSPCATSSTITTASCRQEERECRTKRLERLVEKLCHDFVAQNPGAKQNPVSLVSYFESAGAVIRSMPIAELKRSLKNVSDAGNKSQASSESSQVASLDSIRQSRR